MIQTLEYLELLYILSFSYTSLYLSIHLFILIKLSFYFKRQQTRINQNSTRNLLSFHPSITFLLFVKWLLWNWYCWMEMWYRFLWCNSCGCIKPYPSMENTCLREALAFGDWLEFLYWKMVLVVLRCLTGCELTYCTSTLSVYWIVVFGRLLGYWIVMEVTGLKLLVYWWWSSFIQYLLAIILFYSIYIE